MHDDKTLSIRIPLELAHALESKLQTIRASRKPDDLPPLGRDRFTVETMSDLVRECIALGLKVNARDPDFMRDLLAETFADELKAVLASGYRDPRALKLLKKIAANAEAEPDFG
jgi:hypothetical protein